MTNNRANPARPNRQSILGVALGGILSGAARAVVTWLLDRIGS
jgi:hypothetical protein